MSLYHGLYFFLSIGLSLWFHAPTGKGKHTMATNWQALNALSASAKQFHQAAATAVEVLQEAEARIHQATAALTTESQAKDQAYLERNVLVAFLARAFPSGLRLTKIEGWDPDWQHCVYIDLPTGQVSFHYHDRDAHLFDGLPAYTKPWDGHDKVTALQRIQDAFGYNYANLIGN